MVSLTAIAAVAANGVIANDGDIPWDLPENNAFYRSTVQDKPVVMGRKTYRGTPKTEALNIVLTRRGLDTIPEDVAVANSPEEAYTILVEQDIDHAYVVGGGEVYDAMLPYTDRLIRSELPNAYEGDTSFPVLTDEWEEVSRFSRPEFDIVHYTRLTDC